MKTEEILNEREKTHGNFAIASETHYQAKALFRPVMEKNGVPLYRIEAIEAIIAKINRISHGNHDHADHWDDIAGYAMLGKGKENTENSPKPAYMCSICHRIYLEMKEMELIEEGYAVCKGCGPRREEEESKEESMCAYCHSNAVYHHDECECEQKEHMLSGDPDKAQIDVTKETRFAGTQIYFCNRCGKPKLEEDIIQKSLLSTIDSYAVLCKVCAKDMAIREESNEDNYMQNGEIAECIKTAVNSQEEAPSCPNYEHCSVIDIPSFML